MVLAHAEISFCINNIESDRGRTSTNKGWASRSYSCSHKVWRPNVNILCDWWRGNDEILQHRAQHPRWTWCIKLSIGWINQDPDSREISQSVLDCSRSYQASRSKGNRIALPSTQVVCGLTMLRGTRHKPKTCFVLSGQVCLQNTSTTSLWL